MMFSTRVRRLITEEDAEPALADRLIDFLADFLVARFFVRFAAMRCTYCLSLGCLRTTQFIGCWGCTDRLDPWSGWGRRREECSELEGAEHIGSE